MQNEEKTSIATKLYVDILRGASGVFDKVMHQKRNFNYSPLSSGPYTKV